MDIDFQLIAERLRLNNSNIDDLDDDSDDSADDILAQLEEVNLEPLLTTPSEAAHADTQLVLAIQRGDMAAFEALFFKYQGQIYRTGLAITRDPGAAEEVLQDCFYKTYLNIMNITGDGSLAPWLHRVAVNLSCNALKKRRVHLEPIDDVAEGFITSDPHHSPEVLAERVELQVTMRTAINSLSLKHRIVVTLHYLQDFSLPEIAYILDLPVGTVKSRLHHARKALRVHLEGQNAASPEARYDPAY
ncbi:MAG: sigma-70 family RNA polymerase sigma factor [Chloroflexi bacterium]|nr:sigma-70 family RNA polymerase sigma factor [Chloroflexota bacterium]